MTFPAPRRVRAGAAPWAYEAQGGGVARRYDVVSAATPSLAGWAEVRLESGLSVVVPAASAAPTCMLAPWGRKVIVRVLPRLSVRPLNTLNISGLKDNEQTQTDNKHLSSQNFKKFLSVATTPEEVLDFSKVYHVDASKASHIIIKLSKLAAAGNEDTARIINDKRFELLFLSLSQNISQILNWTLVGLLKSCYHLDSTMEKFEIVKQEVYYRLKNLNVKQISSLASFLASSKQIQDGGNLLTDLVINLELRWTEIEDVSTIVTLISQVGQFSPALMERLENKALQLAESFTSQETRQMMQALALQNQRCLPLLRALSYYLAQNRSELHVDTIVDLLFACGMLNFSHSRLLEKLASDLLAQAPKITPVYVVRYLRSFATLRWFSLPLFDATTQYILTNADQFSPLQLCSIMLSFAHLNFQPIERDSFYNLVDQKISGLLTTLSPELLVDLVWSLCVLQQVKVPYLQSVLGPAFHEHLLHKANDTSHKGQTFKVKIMHINATALLECPEYKCPSLPPQILQALAPRDPRKPTPLQSTLLWVLHEVLGDKAKWRISVDTIYGWQLTAEVLLNSDNQPIPLKDFVAPHLFSSEGTELLPPHVRRMAFLSWEFSNFCHQNKYLLGGYTMARRHLQAAGFIVVEVPWYEFQKQKSDTQKIAYIKGKMSKAIAKEMAK
ncbi:protein TBRG4 [Alligator mississippiensis]|uniref:FAST kinase domain-containing protein 4 n=1 Tax=Alligator mississippiensis TaxID=8496 RepID=A0A151P3Y2_ALLMI|nr:protein TBRG4 [Alligator mississippiensis]